LDSEKKLIDLVLDPGAAAAAFFLHSYRKPKRNRTAFTPTQLLKLENEFEKSHYIVGQERKDLARNLNLPEAKVNKSIPKRKSRIHFLGESMVSKSSD
jgi:homeobox protein EMX